MIKLLTEIQETIDIICLNHFSENDVREIMINIR